MIAGLGQKVFGALLAIAGAVIVLAGHWATPNDMIGDLIAGLMMVALGVTVLLMWSFSAKCWPSSFREDGHPLGQVVKEASRPRALVGR